MMNPGGLLPLACPPAIAVVMPVFNGAAFLGRAIRSVCAQGFPHWELLAVDDGSTDDSYDRLLRLSASDLRVRAFRSPGNRGPSAARNQALRETRAELITYLDCDDEYYPDYLERVYAWRGRTDVCVFGYDKVKLPSDPHGVAVVEPWDATAVREHLLRHNIVCPLGVAHRRDLLDRSGLFDEGLWYEEDWDLWKRFARAGATFSFTSHKSGRYHVRDDSLSRTKRAPDVTY